ncbi:hypothetical protein [Psychrobacter aquimaris]|uniref:hypothetical protein n=1 Tax=Psychrobacter aquimaris TaxID=292733 RepID=UPI003FD2A0C5
MGDTSLGDTSLGSTLLISVLLRGALLTTGTESDDDCNDKAAAGEALANAH